MTRKNMTKNQARRDRNGRFTSSTPKTSSIVNGAFYEWSKNGKMAVVRARKQLRNHVFLVSYGNLYGIARPSELNRITPEQVRMQVTSK